MFAEGAPLSVSCSCISDALQRIRWEDGATLVPPIPGARLPLAPGEGIDFAAEAVESRAGAQSWPTLADDSFATNVAADAGVLGSGGTTTALPLPTGSGGGLVTGGDAGGDTGGGGRVAGATVTGGNVGVGASHPATAIDSDRRAHVSNVLIR